MMSEHRTSATLPVHPLTPADADDVITVFADAFAGYPVMRYVLGADADDARRLRRLIELFVTARVMRGEPMFGIRADGGLIAAATTSFPGRGDAPAEFDAFRAAVWQELGPDAEARYGEYGQATGRFAVADPHVHLNMVGVVHRARGTGLGRRLVEAVHALAAADAECAGVSLNTEDPRNVALYRHLGYEVLGHTIVAPGLQTWAFFRRQR